MQMAQGNLSAANFAIIKIGNQIRDTHLRTRAHTHTQLGHST